MAKISKVARYKNTKKTANSCTVSKLSVKKASVNGRKRSCVVCSHRTPTQLHASTYM